jgi:uncharacterized membrane protein YadS
VSLLCLAPAFVLLVLLVLLLLLVLLVLLVLLMLRLRIDNPIVAMTDGSFGALVCGASSVTAEESVLPLPADEGRAEINGLRAVQ